MTRLPARRAALAAVLALLCFLTSRAAQAGDPLKPYVVLQLDTSSSMQNATGYGPPSCPGSTDTRLSHAKCAINNIANSYGDMVLALARFRQSTTDVDPTNGCTMSAGCPAAANRDVAFEPLVALTDGNNDALARWTDFSTGTCSTNLALDPEIYYGSGTPIGGALQGAKLYWQGLPFSNGSQPWPVNEPGYDPIRNDPLKNVFLPTGQQCRPYIVISLTDGNESCGGDPVAAAASLLDTVVDGKHYRIETKAIGFDAVAPDPQIEGIAHAGGAPDVPGVNEGQYVQNEEQLQLAISQIIADALRFEQCNALDDDCDTLIDEDFPNKGQACHDNGLGVCRGTGVYVCNANGSNTTCQITQPGAMPSPEVCNNLDDNCNGQVDEGLICNCTGVELCNGLDDDCDTRIDEGLVRDCGTDVGVCNAGSETCSAGVWMGCTATGGGPEQCNGLDDDCDGVVDDLTRTCSDLPGGNPGVGPCHEGTQICPPTGTGEWGPCLGEVGPTQESCDTIDNNCNGQVDEGTGGADCSGACGVGHTACVNGVIQCETTALPGDEVCNDHDDDCDTLVDENVPDMGPCNAAPDGTPLCAPGVLRCMGGQYVCQGGDPAQPEICDCDDNNCNGQTDEGDLCAGGATCTHCQCAMPCAAGEFPCPAGRVCVDNFCLVDRCFDVTCDPLPNGDAQTCRDGACVRACDGVSCGPGLVCFGPAGECRPDDCRTFPDRCDADEECVGGTCVANPCANVTCGSGEYCVGGDCVRGCSDVSCPDGQRCRLGACEPDPCGHPCGFGFVCDEQRGECVNDPCPGVICPQGEACNPQTGQCHQDPCLGVECPSDVEVCREGTCDRPVLAPDAGPGDDAGSYVTTGGGGGCSTSGGAGGGGGALVALVLGAALTLRRRVRARVARLGLVALVALAVGSCDINEYCVQCATTDDAAVSDGRTGDAQDGGGDGDAPDACVPTGNEVCNNLDDDCDLRIDEDVEGVGDTCGTDVGECTTGVRECANGVMRCTGVAATAETCNDKDDNCNGMTDEGDPGGGTPCGSDVGECVAGLNHCIAGAIQCVGAIGTPGAVPETCDGRDNDCDNQFDEDIPAMGSCGATDVGQCSFGQLMCVGGVPTCLGAVGPALELCDMLDQDCDGNPTNGFNLQADPRNCGTCNNVCNLPHAIEGCAGGGCTVASCDPGWHNANGMTGDGCEYQCTVTGTQEACNGLDEDCDGRVDEGLAVPDICDHDGACAGTVATCGGAAGWQCNYPATVSVDASGAIIPETRCDGIDNDCDGTADEAHPLKGLACGDSGVGVCQGRGTYVCDAADPTGPVDCMITQPGQAAGPEQCNNLDDDCDGVVDDNPAQDWVSIGGNRLVMKYEASHPDATAQSGGSVTTLACSKAGVQPWTNVTYPQARAACQAIGADLCSEQDWNRACSVISKTAYPVSEPAANNGYMFFEAEDYASVATGVAGGTTRVWVPDTAPSTPSGMGALRASPDTGASVTQANAAAQAPRLDFQVTITTAGNHYVWVRMYGPSDASDAVHVGFNAALPGAPTVTLDAPNAGNTGWVWVQSPAINMAAGNGFVSVWMAEDGVKVDAVVVTRSSSTTSPTEARAAGGTWSYAANPNTAQPGLCNDDDFDTNAGLAGDQDDILVGGARPMCYAAWAGGDRIYDLSGNAKEWTLARYPGANPLRGGASNNETTGVTCRLAFTLANDQFFFPNVGFRCCK